MTQQISIRQQIITNLCEKLPDSDTILGVYRSTVAATQAKALPVCSVRPAQEDIVLDSHTDGQERKLQLQIDYVAAREGADQSAALDTLIDSALVWIEQKVTEDQTMGGLARSSAVTAIAWQMEPGEEEFVGAKLAVEIVYDTTSDPSQPDSA